MKVFSTFLILTASPVVFSADCLNLSGVYRHGGQSPNCHMSKDQKGSSPIPVTLSPGQTFEIVQKDCSKLYLNYQRPHSIWDNDRGDNGRSTLRFSQPTQVVEGVAETFSIDQTGAHHSKKESFGDCGRYGLVCGAAATTDSSFTMELDAQNNLYVTFKEKSLGLLWGVPVVGRDSMNCSFERVK